MGLAPKLDGGGLTRLTIENLSGPRQKKAVGWVGFRFLTPELAIEHRKNYP